MKILVLLLGLILASQANAGGRGGHVQNFDCNVWGGSCACWMTQASGRCGNATAHDVGGLCDGVTDDSTALVNWLTYASGLGATRAVLFIPPGCVEANFTSLGNGSLVANTYDACPGQGAVPNLNVQNAVIWGYNTFWYNQWFGSQTFYGHISPNGEETNCTSGPTNTSIIIQSASAGSTTLTATNAVDLAGNLSVGDWIAVTALGMQGCGSTPINPQLFEYKLVTAINAGTGVVTLNEPLKQTYLSTFPVLGTIVLTNLSWAGGTVTATSAAPHGLGSGFRFLLLNALPVQYNGSVLVTVTGANTFTYPLAANPGPATNPGLVSCSSPYNGGAAAILPTKHNFNTVAQYYGITATQQISQNLASGRDVILVDCNIPFLAMTAGINGRFIGGQSNGMEFDKVIDFLQVSGAQFTGLVTIQSGAINNSVITGTTFAPDVFGTANLNGTAINQTIINTRMASIISGPQAYGGADALVLDGVHFTLAFENERFSHISNYTFLAGVLTISKANAEWGGGNGQAAGMWIPGHTYYTGDIDGSQCLTNNVVFHVSAVADAGANVQITTDLASIPVALTCPTGTRAPTTFGMYHLKSLAQRFSGPADLLVNPETICVGAGC